MAITNREITSLVNASHRNPEQVLGLHPDAASGYQVITVFKPVLAVNPDNCIEILDSKTQKPLGKLKLISPQGLYSLKLRRKKPFCYQLRITTQSNNEKQSVICDDAFAFSSRQVLGELDLHLLREGNHQHAYKKLGAHLKNISTLFQAEKSLVVVLLSGRQMPVKLVLSATSIIGIAAATR